MDNVESMKIFSRNVQSPKTKTQKKKTETVNKSQVIISEPKSKKPPK